MSEIFKVNVVTDGYLQRLMKVLKLKRAADLARSLGMSSCHLYMKKSRKLTKLEKALLDKLLKILEPGVKNGK